MPVVNIPDFGAVNFPDTMSDDEIALAIRRDILKTHQSEPPKETSFMDAAATSAQHSLAKIGNLFGPFEDDHANFFTNDNVSKLRKETEEASKTAPWGAGIGGAAPALAIGAAAAPLVGAIGGAAGLGGLGINALNAGTIGSVFGSAEGKARYDELIEKGVPHEQALKAAISMGLTTAGSNFLPGQGQLAGRILKGAATNVAADQLDTRIENRILSDHADLQQDPNDLKRNLISAGTGGVMGAAFGSRPFERWSGTNEQVAREHYRNGMPEEPTAGLDTDAQRRISTIDRQISQLDSWLANTNDPEKIDAWSAERRVLEQQKEQLTKQPVSQADYDQLEQQLAEVPPKQTETPLEAPEEVRQIPTQQELFPEPPSHVTEHIPDEAYLELSSAYEAKSKNIEPNAPTQEVLEKHTAERSAENNTIDWTKSSTEQIQDWISKAETHLEKWSGTTAEQFIKADILRAQAELDSRLNSSKNTGTPDRLTPELVQHIENNDITSALRTIAERGLTGNLRVLANALVNNKFVVGKGTVGFDFKQQYPAQHDSSTNDIGFKSPNEVTPMSVIHEVLHRATASIFQLFHKNTLSGIEKVSANNINKLWNELKGTRYNELVTAFEAAGGKKDLLVDYLKNETELVSYGTTDTVFAQALSQLHVNNKSSFSLLAEQLSKMFGFSSKQRTAYQDLLENTLQLATHSTVPKSVESQLSAMVGKRIMLNKLGDILYSAGKAFENNVFTSQIARLNPNNKAVQELDNFKNIAEQSSVKALNTMLYGASDKNTPMSLYKYNNGDSLMSIIGRSTHTELHDAWLAAMELRDSFMYKVGESRKQLQARADQALDDLCKTLNQNQAEFLKALHKAGTTGADMIDDMFTSMGIQKSVMRDPLYLFTNRSGKEGVVLSINGTPVRMESFISKAEAIAWMKRVNALGKEGVTVEHVQKDDKDKFASIQDTIDHIMERTANGEDLNTTLQSIRNELTGTTTAIGGHLMKRSGLTGYAGTELFMSKDKQAERFIAGLHNSMGEMVEQARRRALTLKAADISQKYLGMLDNDQKVFDFFVKHLIQRQDDGALATGINKFKETAQSVMLPIGDKSDKFAVDKAIEIANKFMYAKVLGMVPTQWIAQRLGSLNGIRDLFNQSFTWEGVPVQANNNVFKVMASMGAGFRDYGHILKGDFDKLEPELREFVRWASQDTEMFHPHVADAFIERAKFGDSKKQLLQLTDVLLSPTAKADTHSRVAAALSFYHQFKDSGITGNSLHRLLQKMTDDNLYLMAKRHRPRIYGKLGFVGDLLAPLQQYGHNQAGMFLADVKNILREPNGNNTIRLAATAMTAAMTGGVISMPFLVDWDALCDLLGTPDKKLSAVAMKTLPDWMVYGPMSDATGVDFGSSLRNRSILSHDIGMPAMEVTLDALKGVKTLGQEALFGDVSSNDVRQAAQAVIPRGIPMGIADEVLFDAEHRKKVHNKAGVPIEDFGPTERVATFMGTKSVREQRTRQADYQRKQEEQIRTEKVKEAIKLLTDSDPKKQAIGEKRLIEEGYTPQQLMSARKSGWKKEQESDWERHLLRNNRNSWRQYDRYRELYGDR